MADLTLYNVSTEFNYVCDLLDREELSNEDKNELISILSNKLQNSAEEIVRFFKTNDSHIEGIKTEIKALQERQKKAENRAKYLKEVITENMKKMNLPKIETSIGNMVVPNRIDISVDVVDIDKVPTEFKKQKTEISVDKAAIKKHFKETGEIVEGIEIVKNPAKVQFK